MTFTKTAVVALALAASFAGVADSASAATRAERIQAAREARAQAQGYERGVYRPFAPSYNYNGATDRAAPNECRIDNGYGRFDTCDH